MKHFCTYFDSNYALRGLSLFRSLEQHCGEFILHVLCCDEAVFDAIEKLKLPNLQPVRLSEVEAFEPRLSGVKPDRSRAEYLWTLSPIWPLFLLTRRPEIELICYLDADLFFFSSDEPIWQEFDGASILLIEHRFRPAIEHMSAGGRFNVGMMAFRRDENGLACLNWYRERCLEWCYNRHEANRYGDQKYLDEFPILFSGVHVLSHRGANVAPWNWMNEPLEWRNRAFWNGSQPLIFYHFHGFKMFNSWLFDVSTYDAGYGVMPRALARQLLGIYLAALAQTATWLRENQIAISWGYTPLRSYPKRLLLAKLRLRRFYLRPGMKAPR